MAKKKKSNKKPKKKLKKASAPKRKKTPKVKKKPVVKKKKVKVKPIPKKVVKELKVPKSKASEKVKGIAVEKPQEKVPTAASEAAQARARARALARAREALRQKEKLNAPVQAVDTVAYEKQIKLAEPQNKLVLEYIIHASTVLLYDFISSPSGLSEWFADDVNINSSVYSFLWEGSRQEARLLAIKENKSIRFQWTDRAPNTYFEFRIEKNELTEELSLIITDFSEHADDMNSLEVLWQGQVQRLMKVIGSKV